MPVLTTALEASWRNLTSTASGPTHPVAPMLILNGPLVRQLDVNNSYNIYGPGWRANATIGRAIRLLLLNVGGGAYRATGTAVHRAVRLLFAEMKRAIRGRLARGRFDARQHGDGYGAAKGRTVSMIT